eukprot:scaffold11673_cov100-Isochrysis_galbana.AAC.6
MRCTVATRAPPERIRRLSLGGHGHNRSCRPHHLPSPVATPPAGLPRHGLPTPCAPHSASALPLYRRCASVPPRYRLSGATVRRSRRSTRWRAASPAVPRAPAGQAAHIESAQFRLPQDHPADAAEVPQPPLARASRHGSHAHSRRLAKTNPRRRSGRRRPRRASHQPRHRNTLAAAGSRSLRRTG